MDRSSILMPIFCRNSMPKDRKKWKSRKSGKIWRRERSKNKATLSKSEIEYLVENTKFTAEEISEWFR